ESWRSRGRHFSCNPGGSFRRARAQPDCIQRSLRLLSRHAGSALAPLPDIAPSRWPDLLRRGEVRTSRLLVKSSYPQSRLTLMKGMLGECAENQWLLLGKPGTHRPPRHHSAFAYSCQIDESSTSIASLNYSPPA